MCGAIYQSKGYPNHLFFKTSDPGCNTEKHWDTSRCGLTSVEKICICPTVFQEAKQREEQQTKIKSIEWDGIGKLPYNQHARLIEQRTKY